MPNINTVLNDSMSAEAYAENPWAPPSTSYQAACLAAWLRLFNRNVPQESSRQAIEAEYQIDKYGIIRTPGRFEAEHWSIIPYYNWSLDGFGDDSGENVHIFHDITEGEKAEYDLPEDTIAVTLWFSDSGFISLNALNAKELAALEADLADSDQEA